MKENQLKRIVGALIKGAAPVFNPTAMTTNIHCAAEDKFSIRHSGLVIHAMPKIEFPIESFDGFNHDYAELSFSVDFLGCSYNSFTEEYEWAGTACNVDTNFHKLDWTARPSVYGNTQTDGTVVWCTQGTIEITEIESRRVTYDAVAGVLAAMSRKDRSAFLQAIFEEVKGYIDVPVFAS